jgi:hypothetical protein
MPRSFWYFAIKHSACMMNKIPGKYCGKLALPFMLTHGVCPDQRTWLPLFSLYYFYHEKDSDASRSKNQAHTLDLPLMQLWFTIHAINGTMYPTATSLTHIVYHHPSIPLSFTIEDSSSHCIAMISLPSANHILQVLAMKTQMPTPTSHARAL